MLDNKKILKALKLMPKTAILPILESTYLAGDELQLTDLQVTVQIPFASGIEACMYTADLIAALEMMQAPTFGCTYHQAPGGTQLAHPAITAAEGKRILKVTGEHPDNFPLHPFAQLTDDWMEVGALREEDTRTLVQALAFASHDDLRPAMQHVRVGDQIAATDAHRLFFRDIDPLMEELLLTRRVIKLMEIFGGTWTVFRQTEWQRTPKGKYKLVDRGNGPEGIAESSHGALLNEDGVLLSFRLPDERFPDYKVVIPDSKAPVEYTVDTRALRAEIKNASRFANRATSMGTFTLNGKVELQASDIDFGKEYQVELPGVHHFDKGYGDYLRIGLNLRFLDEIAAQCGPAVNFKLWTPNKGVIINDQYLLMPLMLNE